LTGFVANDEDTLQRILDSEAFHSLEDRLLEFVVNYERRVVPVRQRFQF
jgi:hypothetical protein